MRNDTRFGSVYCGVLMAVFNSGISTAVQKDERRCDLSQTVSWWGGSHRQINGANFTYVLQRMETQGRHVAATLHVGTYQYGDVGFAMWTLYHANVTLASTSPPASCCFVTRSHSGSACVPCGSMRYFVTRNKLSQLHLAAFWLRSSISFADTEQNGPGRGRTRIVSDIVSVSMSDVHPTDLNQPLELLLRHTAPKWSAGRVQCVFWEVQQQGWSSRGCRTVWSNASHSQCRCGHLTSFAVVFNIWPSQDTPTDADDVNRRAQSVLTSVMLPLSIVGFVLAIVTIRQLPATDSVKFRLHLMTCIMLSQIVFLSGVKVANHQQSCVLVAVTLHYLLLCAFQWMFLLAVQLVFLLFLPILAKRTGSLSKKHYLLVCIFAYGSPVLVVAIALSSRFQHYTARNYCWLNPRHGVVYSFLVPAYVISAFNYAVFAGSLYVMHKHYRTREWSVTTRVLKWLKGMFTLIDNLGVIYFFGHLSAFSNIFAYAFVVFGGLYGVLFFVFHCLLMKNVRSMYFTWALQLTERCPQLFPRCVREYIRKREVVLKMQKAGREDSLVEVLAAAAAKAATDQSAQAPGTNSKLGWFQDAMLNRFRSDEPEDAQSGCRLNVESVSSGQRHNGKREREDGNLGIGQILRQSVSSTMSEAFGEDSLSLSDQVDEMEQMPQASVSLFRSLMSLGRSSPFTMERKMPPRTRLRTSVQRKFFILGRLTLRIKRKLSSGSRPRRHSSVTKSASRASHVSNTEPIEIVTSTPHYVTLDHPGIDLDPLLHRKLKDIDPMNQQKMSDLDPEMGSDSMDLYDTDPLPESWNSARASYFDEDNVMLTDDSAVKDVTSATSNSVDSLSLSGTWSPMGLVLEAAKSAATEDSDMYYDRSLPRSAHRKKKLYASALTPAVPVVAQPTTSTVQRISVGAQNVFRKLSRHQDASSIEDSSVKVKTAGKLVLLRNSVFQIFLTPFLTARSPKSSEQSSQHSSKKSSQHSSPHSVRSRRLTYPQIMPLFISLGRRSLTWGSTKSKGNAETVDKEKSILLGSLQKAKISKPGTSSQLPAIPTITLTDPDNVSNILLGMGAQMEESKEGLRSPPVRDVTKGGRATSHDEDRAYTYR